ncbi:MAG: hypothetical protein IPI19_01040 [Ignavibacteriales bacterium]|nr:hypothetical protein [Ignavibacteriales bacterium]
MKILFVSIIISVFAFIAKADDKKIEVGIDEQLGKSIPLQEFFVDENGNKVSAKGFIYKTNCSFICVL